MPRVAEVILSCSNAASSSVKVKQRSSHHRVMATNLQSPSKYVVSQKRHIIICTGCTPIKTSGETTWKILEGEDLTEESSGWLTTGDDMLRPSPGTLWLPNDDDDDQEGGDSVYSCQILQQPHHQHAEKLFSIFGRRLLRSYFKHDPNLLYKISEA